MLRYSILATTSEDCRPLPDFTDQDVVTVLSTGYVEKDGRAYTYKNLQFTQIEKVCNELIKDLQGQSSTASATADDSTQKMAIAQKCILGVARIVLDIQEAEDVERLSQELFSEIETPIGGDRIAVIKLLAQHRWVTYLKSDTLLENNKKSINKAIDDHPTLNRLIAKLERQTQEAPKKKSRGFSFSSLFS